MISITKTNIPDYLVGSDFYNALCSEDTEEFTIPEANLKLTPTVENLNDVQHLLNTLCYWGTNRYPDDLLLFLLKARDTHCSKEVRLLLDNFGTFPALVKWYNSLQDIVSQENYSDRYSVVGEDYIPMLIQCLAANCEALVEQALIELEGLISICDKATNLIASQLYLYVKPIGKLSPFHQRCVAHLISSLYHNFSSCDSQSYEALLPILVVYLNSPVEENILFGCKIMAGECELYHGCVISTIKRDAVPRVLSLLIHPNVEIQAAATRIGKAFFIS